MRPFQSNSIDSDVIDLDRVTSYWKKESTESYIIVVSLAQDENSHLGYHTSAGRDDAYRRLERALDEHSSPLKGSIKGYLSQNKDTLITIGFWLLVDHLFFAGAFRERIKAMIDSLLKKVEKTTEK